MHQAYTDCGEASHQKDYPKALDIIFGEDTHQYSQHILVLVMHLTKGLPKRSSHQILVMVLTNTISIDRFGEAPHQRTTQKLYISYLVSILTNTAIIHRFW